MRSLNTFRSIVRFTLVVMLGASFATFVVAVLTRFETDQRFVSERAIIEAELRAQQDRLEMRIATLEEERGTDLDAIEARLKDIALASDSGEKIDVPTIRAPFVIADSVSAVVELVCIDNVDKDIYYTGSGTVVTKDGLIVTNKHLIMSDDGTPIKYCGVGFTTDLQEAPLVDYVATAVAAHSGADLALLRITDRIHDKPMPKEFDWLELVGSAKIAANLDLGDPIFIAGYPGIGADTFTYTQGVVSGRVGPDLIKTSALIDTGTSGGAAFDEDGHYVGVPTAAARGDIGGSLGYLISAEIVEEFVKAYNEDKGKK